MSMMEIRYGLLPWQARIVSLYLMNFSMDDPQEVNSYESWKAFPTNFSVSCGCMTMMQI